MDHLAANGDAPQVLAHLLRRVGGARQQQGRQEEQHLGEARHTMSERFKLYFLLYISFSLSDKVADFCLFLFFCVKAPEMIIAR